MKPTLIFKGDARYTYASGVVRGLELYLLGRADYQKLLDTPKEQLSTVLSEFGYQVREMRFEEALNKATKSLFDLVDKLSYHKELTSIWRTRTDMSNLSAVLKARFFETVLPALPDYGSIPVDDMVRQVNEYFESGRCELPQVMIDAIETASAKLKELNKPVAIDFAVDKVFVNYFRSILPSEEYFTRFWAIYADWLNTRAFLRIVFAGIPLKDFWELFVPDGDLGADLFRSAAEAEKESMPAHFSNTEYGKVLSDVIKEALGGNMMMLDTFFRAKLLSLYKYTKYCAYGLELLWAYLCTKLEEISLIRTIVRAKLAGMEPSKIKEVVTFGME